MIKEPIQSYACVSCVSPKDVDLPFDSLEIPTKLVNVNQSDCDVSSDGVAIYAGILPYYGKAAPLRRNPSGVRTNQFLIDSKVVMVSTHHTMSFYRKSLYQIWAVKTHVLT